MNSNEKQRPVQTRYIVRWLDQEAEKDENQGQWIFDALRRDFPSFSEFFDKELDAWREQMGVPSRLSTTTACHRSGRKFKVIQGGGRTTPITTIVTRHPTRQA